MTEMPKPYVSVILPVHNESENIGSLHASLAAELQALGKLYEIIYIDDGSSDDSPLLLHQLATQDPHTTCIQLQRNFGQTAALSAGVDYAQGDILVLMDADGQNDPADIQHLLAKIEEGYDIVSGWRRRRKDPLFTKKIPSWLANRLISWVTGVHIHDHGCTLKAYRSKVLHHISLYGEMHRFISILGQWSGARVTEIEVRHHPRQSGRSNYSLMRIFKVLLDLPLLVLLGNYLTRPMHFFGMVGLGLNAAAVFCFLRVAKDVFLEGEQASDNGFLILAVFFALAGILVIMLGLLAELMIRVYHESQGKKTYVVKSVVGKTS